VAVPRQRPGPGHHPRRLRGLDPVFVTGYSPGAGTGYDYLTIAYDVAIGAALWARRYNGPANDFDYAYAVATSPDGSRVFVTGYGVGAGTGSDYATIAYDAATGAVLWARRYHGPGDESDVAYSVAASPDGSRVFVTGQSFGGTGTGGDYATIAYDAATGAELWTARYNGPSNGEDYAYAVAASPDGSKVFVTGYSGRASSSDYVTIAYEA
jgi:WD40 repeat protein